MGLLPPRAGFDLRTPTSITRNLYHNSRGVSSTFRFNGATAFQPWRHITAERTAIPAPPPAAAKEEAEEGDQGPA